MPSSSLNDIKKLLQSDWARSRLPAAPNGGRSIASTYPAICREMEKALKLQSRTEWDSYGQGYASYVDAWFYRDRPEFQLAPLARGQQNFVGLHILFCRFAPYFVCGEGSKSWSSRGGSGGFLNFDSINVIRNPAIRELLAKVDPFLSARGLVRLSKEDVASFLPGGYEIETNLSNAPHRLFDALFFWYD